MARRKSPFPKLVAGQAEAALRWLHALGKVTAKDIAHAVGQREKLIDEIKAKLEALGGEGLRFLRGPEALTRKPGKRRRKAPTAAARKAWALTGAYAGSVRNLSKANRTKVRAIKGKKGVEAAIAAAKKLGARA